MRSCWTPEMGDLSQAEIHSVRLQLSVLDEDRGCQFMKIVRAVALLCLESLTTEPPFHTFLL